MTDISHDRDPEIMQSQNAFKTTNAQSVQQAFRKIHSISQNSDSGNHQISIGSIAPAL